MRSFRSLHQLLTLSWWRCRSRRACVRACVHPHARVCGCVCIHMRRRACVRLHAYARAPVYAYMRTRMHTHAHVHACARVYAWARMCTACSECYMHLEQVSWALVHGRVCTLHRCVFTPTYTSVTYSLQVVHVCVYVYMCVYGCVCMDACMCL